MIAILKKMPQLSGSSQATSLRTTQKDRKATPKSATLLVRESRKATPRSATTLGRVPAKQAASGRRSTKRTGSGLTLAKRPVSDRTLAKRKAILEERRRRLFDLELDYIPCRQFLKADAEKLATLAPADALVPLGQHSLSSAAGKGLTPYLASLYTTRLLSKAEEQFYFRRMNWLKFRAAAARGKLDRRRATLKQIDQVETWITDAEAVKSIIITSNLRLVVSIAKKFVDPTNSFEELVSDGNMALLRAVEKFSFELGNRFSTYATYAVQRHLYRICFKSRQQRTRFVSDDQSLREKADDPMETGYCSPQQVGVLKVLFSKFLTELEPRERQIVVARFGFDGKAPRTFRELGAEMGVCKERIRQIQTRAMDKLREMAAASRLEQTVGDWL